MKEEEKTYLNISDYHDTVSSYKRDGKYFICITDIDSHWGEKEISKTFFEAIKREFSAGVKNKKKKKS